MKKYIIGVGFGLGIGIISNLLDVGSLNAWLFVIIGALRAFIIERQP